MAHRGFSRDGLENSMAAFRAAVELGFRHLETDVHTTADGVLLLFHDETLDRITDGRGRISELPAETVARARIGGAEPIPLFEELAAAFPDVRFNLDVKDWNSVDTLAAAIERFGLHDRVLIASFSDRRRRAVLQAAEPPRRELGRHRLQRPLRPARAGAPGSRCCASRPDVRSAASTPCRFRSATVP